jgi:transposase
MATDLTELTDQQWNKIEPWLPKHKQSPRGGRGRVNDRRVFEGILWVLRSGARWKDLPDRYPSPSTCWRRLKEWEEADVWLEMWRAFLGELDQQGQLDWHEVFADGTFVAAKKGAPASEKPNAERVRSLWWWQTARVCLWEFNLPRQARTKSRSSNRRLLV